MAMDDRARSDGRATLRRSRPPLPPPPPPTTNTTNTTTTTNHDDHHEDLSVLFSHVDVDGNGEIEREELSTFLESGDLFVRPTLHSGRGGGSGRGLAAPGSPPVTHASLDATARTASAFGGHAGAAGAPTDAASLIASFASRQQSQGAAAGASGRDLRRVLRAGTKASTSFGSANGRGRTVSARSLADEKDEDNQDDESGTQTTGGVRTKINSLPMDLGVFFFFSRSFPLKIVRRVRRGQAQFATPDRCTIPCRLTRLARRVAPHGPSRSS